MIPNRTAAQQQFWKAMNDLTTPGIPDKSRALYAGDCADAAMQRAEEIRNELAQMVESVRLQITNTMLATQGAVAKCVDDLRDEMATRFNALADEVDAIKGDKQPRDGKEPLDPVILGIAQAYRMTGENRLAANPLAYHLRQAYRERVNDYIEVGVADQSLMSYGLDSDA